MRCAHCDAEFTPKNVRGRFCSARCRAAAWEHVQTEQAARVKGLVTVVAKTAGVTPENLA